MRFSWLSLEAEEYSGLWHISQGGPIQAPPSAAICAGVEANFRGGQQDSRPNRGFEEGRPRAAPRRAQGLLALV